MRKNIQTYYYVSDFEWEAETVISNSTFEGSPHKNFFLKEVPDELAQNMDYLARRKTELKLESYRAKVFSHFPSREKAIFLNISLADAEQWRKRGSRSKYNIYELSVIDEVNSCKANYIWYNYCVRLSKRPETEFKKLFGETPEMDFSESIKSYWRNDPTESFKCPSKLEVLFIGKLKVVQKVKSF